MLKIIIIGALLVGMQIVMSCSDYGAATHPDVDPPVVTIKTPGDGDTICTNPLITVLVKDSSDTLHVSYYIDDILIGEDFEPTYEETWYAGYWGARQYKLRVRAVDIAGRAGTDEISLYVSPEARIVPELYVPVDGTHITLPSSLTLTCNQCPGAQSYLAEWYCNNCDCQNEWCGIKYIESHSHQIPLYINMKRPQKDLTIEWRCRAKWGDFQSHWSEKRTLIIRGGS